MAAIQEYIVFFLVWLVSTILIRAFVKKRSPARLPPSPLALPIIGHLHLLSPPSHQALAKLSSRYGSLICIYLGSVPCIVASSPEMARKLLKTYESFFSNRPHTVANDYLTYGSQDFAYAPYGPYWNFMKKLCTSQLLGGQTLDLLQPVKRHEVKQLIEFLAKEADAGKSVNMGSELIRYTNNVISRIVMSERCSGDEDEAGAVRKLIEETAFLLGKFNFSDYIWFCKNLDLQGFGKRLKEVRDRFDDIMEKIINEHLNKRRKSKEGIKDLLDILLDIAEDPSSEIKLSRNNIKAVIMDLFAAGTDTTARTIEWALAELINHPKIMQNAVQEIESIIGNKRLVQESDIPNLPYLQAIVKETLRLHPGAAIIHRESSKDCTVAGYHIPAKAPVFVNVWAIGRDPNHWENALKFRPERFLSEDGSGKGQLDVRGQHYHFLPFGTGRRGCPGSSLALMTIQTTLAALIQCFELKIEGGKDSVDMEEGSGISLPRANPLICFPVARHNPIPSI
ncbi:cytochrome P450 [Perilla frutescens var. hirtella]|nr:cytochrome P450 [Perilla frutescens var. hirtella]